MSRKQQYKMKLSIPKKSIGLLFFLFIFHFSQAQQSTSSADRPNIILIMADDLGFGDVGFNGNKFILTPHLDELASKGTILSRFYSASSVCSPTRASALTGRNPYRQGIFTANVGHLKQEEITLPELLKKEGYSTGMFGKWHLGTLTTKEKDANRAKKGDNKHYSPPFMHGFDTYFVTESKVPTFDPMIQPKVFDSINGESLRFGWAEIQNKKATKNYGTSYWTGIDQKVNHETLKGENTELILDKAIPFMKNSIEDKNPFFTIIWIHTPHLPVVTSKKYRELYPDASHQEQLYYGSITAMDDQIGRLYEFLKDQKVFDNTILWFASDNGPEVRTPGSAGKFRGKKRDLYEGGIRVPAFIVWPNKIESGQTSALPTVTSDYLPTIKGMLNITEKSPVPLDGIDVSTKIYENDEIRKSPIGFQYPERMAWTTDTFKLVRNGKHNSFELYNIKNDPQEKNNIIEKHPEKTAELKADLLKWAASCEKSEKGLDYSSKTIK